jgi:ADP-ribose pyrophosphatase YjhB (NUDIX family)
MHGKMNKRKPSTERSAGGLVIREGRAPKLLVVEVKNLEGRIVWTFPKGHLEKGETNGEAALREVLEETGWRCAITEPRPFRTVRYGFMRGNHPIKKSVVWFLMRPKERTGTKDPEEIRKVRWMTLSKAQKTLVYPSDQKLLKKLLRKECGDT